MPLAMIVMAWTITADIVGNTAVAIYDRVQRSQAAQPKTIHGTETLQNFDADAYINCNTSTCDSVGTIATKVRP